MKKLLLICFLLGCVSADAWAQQPLSKREKFSDKGVGFRLGYAYQRTHYLELGMYRYLTNRGYKDGIYDYYSFGGGGEIELARQPNYSFKVYAERMLLFVGARLNLNYTKSQSSQVMLLTPEAGFSLMGFAYCYFGYAIPLYRAGPDRLYGFRLSIGWSPYNE